MTPQTETKTQLVMKSSSTLLFIRVLSFKSGKAAYGSTSSNGQNESLTSFLRNMYYQISFKRIFLLSRILFLSILFSISFITSRAQITDKTIFPLNEYLTTVSGSPYPVLVQSKLNAIDKSKFVNVMDYGAKGDGKTYDDYAIRKAFEAARYGVIFPAGRTFLVRTISKITLTHDLTIYAYGATIKMGAMCRYSFLSLFYKSGSYNNNLIWLGGTFDGNKNQQSWPGSPTGNNSFVEEHGRFVGVSFAKFALFKDVKLINLVMDGIGLEGNWIATIANCKASNGARIDFNTGRQATYFKCTRTASKAFYCISDTCLDGAIGIHYSTPTNEQDIQKNTLTVLTNCYLYNQYAGALHFEDCKKVFAYKCRIEGDAVEAYNHACHFSNQTEVASIKNCQFKNMRVNFNEAKSLKLGLIDNCTFTTETSKLSTFIDGSPHLSTHNTFSGACALQQADAEYIKSCTFSNFGKLGASKINVTANSSFINGNTPVSRKNGGVVVNCTYQQVSGDTRNDNPTNSKWDDMFSSYIDVYSDANKYLGRIDCGFSNNLNADQTVTASAAATSTAAATAATANSVSNDLPSSVIKLYPNPAVNEVHVTLNDKVSGKTALNIYDQQGRLVQATTVYKNTPLSVESINVHNLAAGSYVLQIVNDQYKSSLKFVIAR